MPSGIIAALLCAISAVVVCPQTATAAERFDIVIKSGRIVDGSGSPWYRGDVGIRDGKIVKIGRIDAAKAKKVIDAKGLIVAPGFVDMMGQTATPILRDSRAGLNLLRQGITTINAGEGVSAAPLNAGETRYTGWQSMAEYFQLLDLKGLPVNVAQTVGHTHVRRLVIGDVDRRPPPEELGRMQALVREAMHAGATGVSTALIYPPAVYATTEEIAALCKVAGESGGRYYTHMRNEGDQLLEAIDEALEIGAAGGTPVHIFHLKAAGRQNWGKFRWPSRASKRLDPPANRSLPTFTLTSITAWALRPSFVLDTFRAAETVFGSGWAMRISANRFAARWKAAGSGRTGIGTPIATGRKWWWVRRPIPVTPSSPAAIWLPLPNLSVKIPGTRFSISLRAGRSSCPRP